MNDSNEILELERRFWTGGAEYYERKLAREVMMVFPPPAGVLDRGAVLGTIAGAARWSEVELGDWQSAELAPGVVAASYRAAARRHGESPYRVLAGSIYVREGSEWRLVFHQQTPWPAAQEEKP